MEPVFHNRCVFNRPTWLDHATVQAAFEKVTDNVARGVDAVDYNVTFWEKFLKLERSYAKGLEELCESRTAKLARMFQTTSVEHVKELDDAWVSCISQLKGLAKTRSEVRRSPLLTVEPSNRLALRVVNGIPTGLRPDNSSKQIIAHALPHVAG